MLQKMKRIQVIGPKTEFNRVVDLLYREGTIHLEDVCKCVSEKDLHLQKTEKERSAEVSEILSRISVILATLPVSMDETGIQQRIRTELQSLTQDEIIARARELIHELESRTKELASRRIDLKLKITTLERYEKVLNIIQPMEREIPALMDYEVTILLIQKEFATVLDLIKKELTEITHNQFEMSSSSVDEDTLATIMVFHKRYSQQVHSFIFSVNVNEVRLPQEFMGKPFYEMFAQIESDKAKANEEIHLIDEQLDNLSHIWYHELLVLKSTFEDISMELEAFNKFGHSEFTFVVMGWIPKKFLKRMKEAIKKQFNERVVVSELAVDAAAMENAPTFYDNPRWVRPFEVIMQLASPPGYREVDPVPVLAIFFPFFFGLMVGDIGYGLVILAFALFMKSRAGTNAFIKNFSEILIISSIPTIIFGFLFGEFFGDFGETMGWLHPINLFGVTWNRIEALIPLLIFAVAVGVIHVFLGLIVGIRNELIRKNKKHLAEKVGMLMALSAIIIVAALAIEIIPAWTMYPTVALGILALCLLIYGAGAMGPMEIMSSIGNILSYARLMAIGMASVILALVANRLGGEIGIAIIGITIAILLHALNIALAMFSPSIHSIRLHLVEFFSKFYHGKGVVYKPFSRGPGGERKGSA